MFTFAMAVLTGRSARAEREDGATAVEYGLLLAFIAGVIVVVVATLGTSVSGWFTSMNSAPW